MGWWRIWRRIRYVEFYRVSDFCTVEIHDLSNNASLQVVVRGVTAAETIVGAAVAIVGVAEEMMDLEEITKMVSVVDPCEEVAEVDLDQRPTIPVRKSLEHIIRRTKLFRSDEYFFFEFRWGRRF